MLSTIMYCTTIPLPCNENWQQMSPAEQGRHCHACSKTVIDCTGMNDQSLATFIAAKGNGLCGRFRNDQLGRDIPYNSKVPSSKQWRKLLACVAMIFLLNTSSAQRRVFVDTVFYRWTLSESSKALVKQQEAMASQTEYTVRGKLRDEQGKPMTGVQVQGADGAVLATSDANGFFSFRLPGRPVNNYTILVAEAKGKQKAVRSIHYTGFPAVLDIVLVPPASCCNGITMGIPIIKEKCCDINISWPVDKMFVKTKQALPARKKTKKKLRQ